MIRTEATAVGRCLREPVSKSFREIGNARFAARRRRCSALWPDQDRQRRKGDKGVTGTEGIHMRGKNA